MQDAQPTSAPSTLLGPEDPAPFSVFHREGRAELVMFCDHAGRAFPKALGTLGLGPRELEQHIAWDIGIAGLGRRLAHSLDAPFFMTAYSRLVIDCNRHLDDPTSIAQESDRIPVPGNRGLSAEDRRRRQDEIFRPYHDALMAEIKGRVAGGRIPVIISLHSFTPVMNGFHRPWHIGVLWNEDERISRPLIERLQAMKAFVVGDNQPYTGKTQSGYTIPFHAERNRLPHVMVEIRQDLIGTKPEAEKWADILGDALAPILAQPRLYRLFEK